jgi:2-iminobutanoate/2-iminopropanoate deaminase|uniref:RidA family protein n=1 Tax=candidate division WOR-3 bacterium TaxID=2052148 RepID=A0A7C6EH49_UNCW3
MKKIIKADKAPKAIGPYSQGVIADGFIYTAGQIGLNPLTGNMVEGGVKEQTMQALENIKAVIEAGGANLDNVVKTTVYLIKSEDFPLMNEVYARYFNNEPPARTTIFVGGLPKGALVEIEAIARL